MLKSDEPALPAGDPGGAGPRPRAAADRVGMGQGKNSPALARALGPLDATLLTIGSIVGTGIFLTAGDVARAAPSAAMVMLVWAGAGLLTLAGALTYAELGAMFPRAGGMYHYLREAWGPFWGFLFG